ncbi:uncharacterized protein K02A2.6-like [Toxorhynchites rutilus septentrionalis]|uniref:uncharacterized protein K02A2.6-like n=1 Tax=Toxorhynchites rutilus septentrionalis TaxID=329112 RepID=UPI00247AC7FA|nr:uncharacterized protein K02A2.6-like [Toxorhynchites rutilus septentrionalis]
MKQKEGERFADFVLRLRQQATDCGFDKYSDETRAVLTEIFIIDVIIEGCLSSELRRRILQKDCSLSEIESLGAALESVETQVQDFGVKSKDQIGDHKVLEVSSKPVFKFNKRNDLSLKKFTGKKPFTSEQRSLVCLNCGHRDHQTNNDVCPAKGKICYSCRRVGHFGSRCRFRKFQEKSSNKVRMIEHRNTQSNSETFNDTGVESESGKTYYAFYSGNETNVVVCEIGGVRLDMLIDSGSDANLITDQAWETLKKGEIVVHQSTKGSSRVLKGYASDISLPIMGTFVADVKLGKLSTRALFYVIKGGQRCLLGDQTSKDLGVLKVGLEIQNITTQVTTFSKIKDIQVQIHMDPAIKPVFQPLRRVPMPLEDAVNRKLEQLLLRDIIEVKEGPASWVSPLVVVGKTNGEPRICLDLRRVNEAVLRERHPMPTVDDYLARLGEGRFWSKLDIKEAFLQIELAPESRDVTTFISSKGLYRFKRLPFGLVTAPELFQKVVDQILAGCQGTYWYLDDVIIEGRDRKEHDNRLEEV